MTINVDKTEAMIMKRKEFTGPLAPVEIGGKTVEYKKISKVLGLYIDNELDAMREQYEQRIGNREWETLFDFMKKFPILCSYCSLTILYISFAAFLSYM